ncbi:hypothetical protein BRAS3843_110005 [Bradyrhizobium sp. STM 3843]|nr:hypothetical protein BRAS3843_110005 [Bradyrhizobium sp. STM 3843]
MRPEGRDLFSKDATIIESSRSHAHRYPERPAKLIVHWLRGGRDACLPRTTTLPSFPDLAETIVAVAGRARTALDPELIWRHAHHRAWASLRVVTMVTSCVIGADAG